MLGKLMKYEFKATARLFIPMYLILLVLSSVNRVLLELSGYSTNFTLFPAGSTLQNIFEMLAGTTTMIYVLAIFAVLFLTFIIFVYRFYKNLLGDEGYLMMTLPVKPSQHLWAKLHTSLIWTICSALACCLSLVILLINADGVEWMVKNLPEMFRLMFQIDSVEKVHIIFYIIELAAVMVIGVYSGVMFYYACLAIGHRMSRKHKLLSAVGAYLIISFAMQVIGVILLIISGSVFDFSFMNLPAEWIFHIMMIASMLMGIAEFAVFFLITNNIPVSYTHLV